MPPKLVRMRLLLTITLLLLIGSNASYAQGKSNVISNIRDGIASFYHDKFEGRPTANGEIFKNDKFTAASNSLKLGSYVKVTNLSNGEVVYVRINDRMAKTNRRLIDLAAIAARKLDFQTKGIAKVKVEPVSEEEGRKAILAQREALANEKQQAATEPSTL